MPYLVLPNPFELIGGSRSGLASGRTRFENGT